MAIAAAAGVSIFGALAGAPGPAASTAGWLEPQAAAAAVHRIADPPSNSRVLVQATEPMPRPAPSVPPAAGPDVSVPQRSTSTGIGSTPAAAAGVSPAVAGAIPAQALRAYRNAADVMAAALPGCRLTWSLLAGIGRIESDHGRFGGNVMDANGTAHPGIIGPPLNGAGVAAIPDTDAGRWDGDPVWDRAVGPMQFIPSTWRVVGIDGNNDGVKDPQNIDDASLAAGVYLCSYGTDLSTPAGARTAVFGYNHSASYVATVLAYAQGYASGTSVAATAPAGPSGTGAGPSTNVAGGVPVTSRARMQPSTAGGPPPAARASQPPAPSTPDASGPSRTRPASSPSTPDQPSSAVTAPHPSATSPTAPAVKQSPSPSTSPTPSRSPTLPTTPPTPTPTGDPAGPITPPPTANTEPTGTPAPPDTANPTWTPSPTTAPTTSPPLTPTTPPPSDPSPSVPGPTSITPSSTSTPSAPSPSMSASADPVVCQEPDDPRTGTLSSCTQGDTALEHYLCRDPSTDQLMRLGTQQQEEAAEPPGCVYVPSTQTAQASSPT